MLVVTLVLVLLTLAALYLAHKLFEFRRYYKKVERLPSPKGLPVLGHALDLMIPRRELPDKMLEYSQEHPDLYVLWLGPIPYLMVINPHFSEVILGSMKHIDKPVIPYRFMEAWLGTGLLTSTGAKWHSHRKLITPTFHFKILENFVEIFAEKSQILIKKLEKELGSEDFDVHPYITTCALDIICETAMGIELHAQDQGLHSKYVEAVMKITELIMTRTISPWLFPDFIFNITPEGRRLNKYLNILHNFTNKVIKERKELYKKTKSHNINEDDYFLGRKKKLAFLDLLLESSETGNKLTNEEIREEVDTFMFEGHDTTTAGICWALRYLGMNLDIQEKVFEEMENIFLGSDRSPTMQDLNEMKYLERVIKETLRLRPSVPIIGRELKEDIELGDYTIPAGMRVALSLMNSHYNEQYFPEPETFNPDNFLPEKITDRHPYAYIPFSAGPRNCIGQKFAMMEMKMALSYIVRHYKFESTEDEVFAVPDLILRPENGIHLKIAKRVTSN